MSRIAVAAGLSVQPGATAISLRKLIEGAGINITEPPNGALHWERVEQRTEGGGTRVEMYPRTEPPASDRKGITAVDRETAIQANAPSETENENENEKLRRENAELKAIMELKLAALEERASAEEREFLGDLTCAQLRRRAMRRGIDVTHIPNRKELLIGAIRGNEDPSECSQ